MTSPTEDTTVRIALTERPEGELAIRPVGIAPYILVTVEDVTADSVDLAVEVGGGTPAEPRDELAAFLRLVADSLDQGVVAEDAAETEE